MKDALFIAMLAVLACSGIVGMLAPNWGSVASWVKAAVWLWTALWSVAFCEWLLTALFLRVCLRITDDGFIHNPGLFDRIAIQWEEVEGIVHEEDRGDGGIAHSINVALKDGRRPIRIAQLHLSWSASELASEMRTRHREWLKTHVQG